MIIMRKNYKTQKKKNTNSTILGILLKTLVATVIIVVTLIVYKKVDFSTSSLTFSSPKKSRSNVYTPSELRWFDDFRGVENVSNKDGSKKRGQGGASSGFKFEGLGK